MASAGVKLDTIVTSEFQKMLRKLGRRGGEADFIYSQVMRALVQWEHNEEAELKLTKHGESRVPHVVKYDLKGYYRLVAYEHAGKRVPLFVGTHDEADRWLDGHKGRDFTVDLDRGHVTFTPVSTDSQSTDALIQDLEATPRAQGPVLDRLPADLLTELGLSEAVLSSLKAYVTFDEVEDSKVWTLVNALPFPSEEARAVIIQAIALTARGQIDTAVARIQLYIGSTKTATERPEEFAKAIDSGTNSESMVRLSDITVQELDRINRIDGFTDWMLYLHPEQKDLVDLQTDGPVRILGVSGSGKTSVLIHRAKAMAKLYPQQRILVLRRCP